MACLLNSCPAVGHVTLFRYPLIRVDDGSAAGVQHIQRRRETHLDVWSLRARREKQEVLREQNWLWQCAQLEGWDLPNLCMDDQTDLRLQKRMCAPPRSPPLFLACPVAFGSQTACVRGCKSACARCLAHPPCVLLLPVMLPRL